MEIETGKYYRTRGGWKALVLYKLFFRYIDETITLPYPKKILEDENHHPKFHYTIVNKPGTIEEMLGFCDKQGKIISTVLFSVQFGNPSYGQKIIIDHPADLIAEWKEEDLSNVMLKEDYSIDEYIENNKDIMKIEIKEIDAFDKFKKEHPDKSIFEKTGEFTIDFQAFLTSNNYILISGKDD